MRALMALVRTELMLASRRGESLLITAVVPLVLLVFFGSVAPVAQPAGGGTPLAFLVPGILALAVMSTSMVSLGISTAYERFYGVLKRLAAAPVPNATLLGSRTLAVVLVQFVQCVGIGAVARFALGWEPSGSVPLAIAALCLGSLAFAGIGLFLAGTLRAEATLAVTNGLYLVFLLLGGFVFPVEQLPPALGWFARLLPGAALAEATRGALIGLPLVSVAGAWVTLAVWATLAAGAAVATFRVD